MPHPVPNVRRTVTRLGSLVVLLAALSACGPAESDRSTHAATTGTVEVDSSDDSCDLASTTAPSGHVVFEVTNSGSEVTEFYLYAEDGLRVVGEVENLGPGLSRDLVVRATPGTYVTSCRPGLSGDRIRADFTVTDSGSDTAIEGIDQAAIDAATGRYEAYVEDQAQQLLDRTRDFTRLYSRGRDGEARALFPRARGHWERIETVAESFGDLDPRMDLREADLEPGQRWTGWHRIEKDLWPPASGYEPMTSSERAVYADDLLASTRALHERVQTLDYTVDQIGNGAKGLLDEVASGKITGEEDIWSHTDLYDFQANIDGARVGYEGLQPLLEAKDPALSRQIRQAFASLQEILDRHRTGPATFVSYDTVTDAQRKRLSDAVNALAEPLSRMTGAITL